MKYRNENKKINYQDIKKNIKSKSDMVLSHFIIKCLLKRPYELFMSTELTEYEKKIVRTLDSYSRAQLEEAALKIIDSI